MSLFKKKPKLLDVGSVAPAFELTDHTGQVHRLSDYTDKRVLIWFYPKADTPG
jgi:peroxiredoxin Q/BCP